MKDRFYVSNIKNINKKNLPYILAWVLYYSWIIVFTTWWTASPINDKILSANLRSLLHCSFLIVSAILACLFKKDWFKRTGIIGAVLAIITSIIASKVIEPAFHPLSIIIFGITLGIINVSFLVPFVYIMNNTERFYSMISSFLLISILLYLKEVKILTINNNVLFPLIFLFTSLIPVIFFKKSDLEKETLNIKNIPSNKKVLYVTIIINSLYILFCKGIGKAFLDSAVLITKSNLYTAYYIGGLVGCIIYFLIYKYLKNSNHFVWNFTFTVFILALFIFAVANNLILYNLFSLLIGVASTIGMINSYYILGVIGKKYWSHSYIRVSVVIISLLGGVSGIVAGKYVSNLNVSSINTNVLIISFLTIIIVLSLSPLLSKTYFKGDWSADAKKFDIDNENIQQFKQYKLTPKEIQLCRLLIEGNTLRQASSIMNIKESTIMGYQSKIYKKLNINTRNELLLKFK